MNMTDIMSFQDVKICTILREILTQENLHLNPKAEKYGFVSVNNIN